MKPPGWLPQRFGAPGAASPINPNTYTPTPATLTSKAQRLGVSLNCRLESNKEEEDTRLCTVMSGERSWSEDAAWMAASPLNPNHPEKARKSG